jgi:uncharacterized protein (TIGR03086 family)
MADRKERRSMADLKELHRRNLERFGVHVAGVTDDQWNGPTPCTEWDVRMLVNHLVSENLWMPPLLEGQTIADVGGRLEGDLLGNDPRSAWDASAKEVGVAVEAVDLGEIVHVSYGDITAEAYVFEVMADLAIHGWDLARAIGADETMDTETVDLLFGHFKPQEEALKASGAFGPRVDPPSGADKQTQLLAVFGRVA